MKQNGRRVENGKYVLEWYDDPSRRPPSNNPFLEGDPFTRKQGQPPRMFHPTIELLVQISIACHPRSRARIPQEKGASHSPLTNQYPTTH
jgi:hypothetical protein